MLQQVLKEMYIDPELLEALDEVDKETLFCLMKAEQIKRRAEQVQKWKEWDAVQVSEANTNKLPSRPRKKSGKSVKWLLDAAGEVVVDEIRSLYLEELEEHAELKTSDTRIPTSETDSRSEPITTVNEVKNINADKLPESDKLNFKNADAMLSNATGALRNGDPAITRNNPQSDISLEEVLAINAKEIQNSPRANRLIYSEQRSVLRELSSNEVRKVAKQVAEWETRTNQNDSKSTEVTKRVKPVVKIVRSNEPVDETDELRWRAQMRKANEVGARIRNITRLAREEHRRSLIENGNEPLPNFATSENTSSCFVINECNKPMPVEDTNVSRL